MSETACIRCGKEIGKGRLTVSREAIPILFRTGIVEIKTGLPKNAKCVAVRYNMETDSLEFIFEGAGLPNSGENCTLEWISPSYTPHTCDTNG